MFNYLVIGGRFDDKGGKPSGYVRKLFETMKALNPQGTIINGGKFKDLKTVAEKVGETSTHVRIVGPYALAPFYGVVFWFPDVPNDKKKLVRDLKKKFPFILLVTSKNNRDEKYSFHALVGRALSVKANLFLEYTGDKTIIATIGDPLGNCFLFRSDSIDRVATTLMSRVHELLRFTRMGSVCESTDMPPLPYLPEGYFYLLRNYADRFHECIHGASEDRFLGNMSFRCERGFPSFKSGEYIWVSKRNIDKRHIEPEGFVPTMLSDKVWYRGLNKPSVDTPIQLMLYNYYPHIRFMLHSHTYLDLPYMTDSVIPCGAVEEFLEITRTLPERDMVYGALNLRGHGSLVMAEKWESLQNLPYIPRQIPEDQYSGLEYTALEAVHDQL